MPDELLRCVVEIPKGSRNKYEYDSELDAIKLDRVVPASVSYPTDYGYVPDTLAADGDALDVLVCVTHPTFPGCTIFARVVGLFKMADEKGPDDHVVVVPLGDPNWSGVEDLEDLPRQLRDEIHHFFSIYKQLDPERWAEAKGWAGREAAWALIEQTRERFRSSS